MMRDTLRTCRLLLDTEWEVNSWWKVIIEIRIENIKTLMMAEIVKLTESLQIFLRKWNLGSTCRCWVSRNTIDV